VEGVLVPVGKGGIGDGRGERGHVRPACARVGLDPQLALGVDFLVVLVRVVVG
jgi:hypothetical protein